MLDIIIQLLNIDHHKGVSDRVDFAKGRDKIPTSIKEGWKQIQRKR